MLPQSLLMEGLWCAAGHSNGEAERGAICMKTMPAADHIRLVWPAEQSSAKGSCDRGHKLSRRTAQAQSQIFAT